MKLINKQLIILWAFEIESSERDTSRAVVKFTHTIDSELLQRVAHALRRAPASLVVQPPRFQVRKIDNLQIPPRLPGSPESAQIQEARKSHVTVNARLRPQTVRSFRDEQNRAALFQFDALWKNRFLQQTFPGFLPRIFERVRLFFVIVVYSGVVGRNVHNLWYVRPSEEQADVLPIPHVISVHPLASETLVEYLRNRHRS